MQRRRDASCHNMAALLYAQALRPLTPLCRSLPSAPHSHPKLPSSADVRAGAQPAHPHYRATIVPPRCTCPVKMYVGTIRSWRNPYFEESLAGGASPPSHASSPRPHCARRPNRPSSRTLKKVSRVVPPSAPSSSSAASDTAWRPSTTRPASLLSRSSPSGVGPRLRSQWRKKNNHHAAPQTPKDKHKSRCAANAASARQA